MDLIGEGLPARIDSYNKVWPLKGFLVGHGGELGCPQHTIVPLSAYRQIILARKVDQRVVSFRQALAVGKQFDIHAKVAMCGSALPWFPCLYSSGSVLSKD